MFTEECRCVRQGHSVSAIKISNTILKNCLQFLIISNYRSVFSNPTRAVCVVSKVLLSSHTSVFLTACSNWFLS